MPPNPLWAEAGAGVGKVAGSASSDKMLILTVHPFLKHLKNTLWADVSFMREGFNKVYSFAALPLCFAEQAETQSGTCFFLWDKHLNPGYCIGNLICLIQQPWIMLSRRIKRQQRRGCTNNMMNAWVSFFLDVCITTHAQTSNRAEAHY